MKKDVEEIITIIDEKTYQQFKKDMCKEDDCFSKTQLGILMQFLMQRQRKVIKNEEKI